jgi:hypothetical protein
MVVHDLNDLADIQSAVLGGIVYYLCLHMPNYIPYTKVEIYPFSQNFAENFWRFLTYLRKSQI